MLSLLNAFTKLGDKTLKQYFIIRSLWHKLVTVPYSRYEPVKHRIKLEGGKGAAVKEGYFAELYLQVVMFWFFEKNYFIFAGKDEERNCCRSLLFHKASSKT